MKVALVYDRVNKWGGAERVLLALHEIFPEAPLYTSVHNEETAPWAKVFPKVIPSFLQKFPFAKTHHDWYAPLMPFAFEAFDFSEYDLVVSVSSEAAKGIVTGPNTLHINYCLTPTRYLWSGYDTYFGSKIKKIISYPLVKMLRKWDYVVSRRPDEIISISTAVQERVKKYYKKDTNIVFPPADNDRFQLKSPHFRIAIKRIPVKEYYLIVSRLVPYKRVDLAIEAFNKLDLPLVIVGQGSEYERLKKIAGPKVKVIGSVTEEELALFYKSCQAFIMPQEEDYGIAAVEAQSAGKPVIAYKAGGALDTVQEGITGLFFEEQTSESLINAVKKYRTMKFDPSEIKIHAKKFSKGNFQKRFVAEINKIWYTQK
jgi:glycosyltransferase involved in cell wall biosynthesis